MPGRLRSMTGFARTRFEFGGRVYMVELRSVNGRYFDVRAYLPAGLSLLEQEISKILHQRVFRGRLEITIKAADTQGSGVADFMETELPEIHKVLERLRSDLGIQEPVRIADVLAAYQVAAEAVTRVPDPEAFLEAARPALEEATRVLVAMRTEEGAAMDRSLVESLEAADLLVDSIEALAKEVPGRVAEKLKERLATLLSGDEIDPQRIAQEVAILADRADVTEEVVRIRSHLAQFRKIRHDEPPHGRKLEFLLQEIHREANTIAAKSPDVRISRAAVELKHEVEKMREIVRNVE